MPGPPCGFRIRDGASSGVFGAVEAEGKEAFVDDVGADPAFAALDPLLDLGQMLVDDAGPPRRAGHRHAGVAGGDVTPDGFRIDPANDAAECAVPVVS